MITVAAGNLNYSPAILTSCQKTPGVGSDIYDNFKLEKYLKNSSFMIVNNG